MSDSRKEIDFLESVTHTYITSKSSQDRLNKTLAMRTFESYMRPGKRALEFGCLDGFMSSLIAEHVDLLTVVDGSPTFIKMAKERVPGNVEFVHSLFEGFAS